MYPITNDLLTRFQNGDKQYVRMTIGSTVIDGSDIMQGSFSVNRYVETNESVAVGSVVAAELTCVLNNYDGTYDNTSFIGSEAYVEVGVEDSNHVVQYIPLGYFIFDEATRTKNAISLAALDRMAKFDDPIVASSFSFPYTLTNLLSRICTLCSVTKGTFTLTNSSYSVAELPEETKTYRDLLRWICEVSGSNGYFSYDGKLYLGWYGTTSQFNILPSNRTQSELDPNTFTITGVTILTGDNNKYTAGTNTRPITITNNPLINTTTAQSVANTLNTKLNGFSYTPFNAVMLPSPMIYPMDRATFTTADGTTVAVSVTEVTFKLNGNTAIACKGEMTVKGRAYSLADQTFYASNIAAGSITADKIAAGAVNADKIAAGSISVSMMDSSAQAATLNSNLNVGGTNLVSGIAKDTEYNATLASSSYNNYIDTLTLSIPRVLGAKEYVVSFDAKASKNCDLHCYWYNPNTTLKAVSSTGQSGTNTDGDCLFSVTTSWSRYWVKWTQNDSASSNKSLIVGRIDKPSSGSITAYIRAVKMEVGNVPTTWSPAPSDMANIEQRIYYRSNSTTAPTAPTTWVTATTSANATWTTKRMQYDRTYKYLYTCIQRRDSSGSISSSTVLLDDTTTVIDGGNIITGSIAANKVDVNGDLSAFNANIGGWAIGTNAISKTVSNKTITLDSQTPAITAQSGNHIAGFRGAAEIFTSYEATATDYGTSFLKGNEFEQENKVWEIHPTWSDWVTKSKTKLTDGELFQTSIVPDSSGYYSTGTTYVSRLDGKHLWFENGYTDVRPNYITITDGTDTTETSKAHIIITDGTDTTETTKTRVLITDGTNFSTIYKDRFDINRTTGTSPNYTTDNIRLYGQSIYSERIVYVNSVVSEQYRATHTAGSFSVAEGGVTKSSLNALGVIVNDASGNEASVLKRNALKVNTHDLLRMSPHFAQMFATEITSGNDIKTTPYLKCGQYYTVSDAITQSLSNCPTRQTS